MLLFSGLNINVCALLESRNLLKIHIILIDSHHDIVGVCVIFEINVIGETDFSSAGPYQTIAFDGAIESNASVEDRPSAFSIKIRGEDRRIRVARRGNLDITQESGLPPEINIILMDLDDGIVRTSVVFEIDVIGEPNLPAPRPYQPIELGIRSELRDSIELREPAEIRRTAIFKRRVEYGWIRVVLSGYLHVAEECGLPPEVHVITIDRDDRVMAGSIVGDIHLLAAEPKFVAPREKDAVHVDGPLRGEDLPRDDVIRPAIQTGIRQSVAEMQWAIHRDDVIGVRRGHGQRIAPWPSQRVDDAIN